MSVEQTSFGKTKDGQDVERYQCENSNGLSMSLITYGAIMQTCLTPDRNGEFENINLSCPTIEAYEACSAYLGATVGRFCNRIGKATFQLNGKEYKLAANNPPNSLHGGIKGFSHAVWNAEPVEGDDQVGVRFHHTSPDGDEGFPGELKVTAEYLLNDQNELTIRFSATTDAPTVINLTNHNYWNLAGENGPAILDHVLQVEADEFLDVDDTLIPTGKLNEVAGTELDFRQATRIGDRIATLKQTPANGYDHCYALREREGKVTKAAYVVDPASGRTMEIKTSQPGIQLYTGNWLDGTEGSGGFQENTAFCLETQHFPDAPNVDAFESTVLYPGETFQQTTVHQFGVETS